MGHEVEGIFARESGWPQLDIARGIKRMIESTWIFGLNPDVDTGAAQDIWDFGGTWVPPTVAQKHTIVSDSADDSVVGTGAQSCLVLGLNAQGEVQQELVPMLGLTPVQTEATWLIVHRIISLTGGSGGSNAGNISCMAEDDDTLQQYILVGGVQSFGAIFRIPSNRVGYAINVRTNISSPPSSATVFWQVQTMLNIPGALWTPQVRGISTSEGTSGDHQDPEIFIPISSGTILKGVATTDANNTGVSMSISLVLAKD